MIFESLRDKAFLLERDTDYYAYFYACVLAANPGSGMTFNEFADEVDKNPQLVVDFMRDLNRYEEFLRQFAARQDVESEQTGAGDGKQGLPT
jgi:hypothetical protein